MKRISILSVLIVLSTWSIWANNITLTVEAPNAVAAGQKFQIKYTLNSQGSDLRVNFPSELDVLAGPYTSISNSSSYTNGRIQQEASTSYTYVALASKEGSITIPEAQIKAKEGIIKSKAFTIKVAAASAALNNNNSNSSGDNSGNTKDQSNDVNKFFLRAELSKTKVYEQEALLYTLKIYSRYANFQPTENANPVFTGFLSQQIPNDPNQQVTQETVNGRIYLVYTLRKDILFPQRTGNLKIDPIKMGFVIQQEVRSSSNNPFDNFFATVRNVNTNVQSNSVKVDVLPLPDPKPTDFSGGLGIFTLNSSVNTQNLQVNSPLTLKISIKGKGNLKVLKTIKPEFPSDFEVFDPKVTTNITNGVDGASGSIDYEFLTIPRHPGTFTINPIKLSYFDIKSKSYKTLSSQQYKIEVNKNVNDSNTETQTGGNAIIVSNQVTQEELKILGQDIRFIHINNMSLSERDSHFFNTTNYWLLISTAFTLALICFILMKKQIRESQNVSKQKHKKASRMAQRKLKSAHTFMKTNQRERFYEEVMKAMLNYLEDKLAITTSELTKNNVESILRMYQVNETEVSTFMKIIHDCEFARYSSVTADEELNVIYKQAESIIEKIDGQIKKQK